MVIHLDCKEENLCILIMFIKMIIYVLLTHTRVCIKYVIPSPPPPHKTKFLASSLHGCYSTIYFACSFLLNEENE